MGSPAKRVRTEDDVVVGYLHCISPVKSSLKNNRYFEASLQTAREEYHRVVSFSVDKRVSFTKPSENSVAVKLGNIKKNYQ